MRFKLKGRVSVNPTEDPEKVRKAVRNIFAVQKLILVSEGERRFFIFEADSREAFEPIRNILHQDRVRDAVRRALRESVEGSCLTFHLNKQVAYAGHVSLCQPHVESPLGEITVEVECEDTRQLIDWLSPSSRRE